MASPNKKPSTELNMPVWQFVRLMVELEKDRGNPAFRAWQDVWRELDRRLDKLGRTDSKAYSTLMMDTDVTLTGVTDPLRDHLDRALGKVLGQISQRLDATDAKDPGRKDLDFEFKALKKLRQKIQSRG